jgi:hypothetical protein
MNPPKKNRFNKNNQKGSLQLYKVSSLLKRGNLGIRLLLKMSSLEYLIWEDLGRSLSSRKKNRRLNRCLTS